MNRGSASLVIMEMQIKTSMSYYYTSTRIDQTERANNTKSWQRCGAAGAPINLTPQVGIYPKEMKTCQPKTCT